MANTLAPNEVRAIQRSTRQSPYKMRLVIDQIRGKSVNDALALLKFSKKFAAKQIEKVLTSAVANAEFKGRVANESVDVDELYVARAVVNEGTKLKRFMPAAMGRATPIHKRTSHVEIVVAPRKAREVTPPRRRATTTSAAEQPAAAKRTARPRAAAKRGAK